MENSLLQYRWAVKFFFDRYRWKGDEKVLDIGCGDWRLTKLISTYVPRGGVLGMDKSFSMISHARSAYPNQRFPNLDFLLSDATDAAFYQKFPEQFDLVVAFVSLHWIKEQKPILEGITTVLKPTGRAYIRLTSKGWDPIQEIADELAASSKWKNYFKGFVDPVQRFSVSEYTQIVQEAGFIPIRIEDVTDNDTLQSVELLAKQVKVGSPMLNTFHPICKMPISPISLPPISRRFPRKKMGRSISMTVIWKSKYKSQTRKNSGFAVT